jgi:hypothetical protein
MYDTEYADLFGMPPLDIEAFLRGDAQGRDRAMSGADAALARKYLKSWHMPAEDYERRREALALQQYSYFGNCPRCEAEGAIYSLPYPHGKSDWLVCSEGCEVRWCFGSGHFRAYTPDDLSEQEELAILEKLEGYDEVEPLLGWKLDLPSDLDVGIRMLPAEDVGECVLCGFAVLPGDLRMLSRFIFFWAGGLPLLSFNRQEPLCMVCGEEFGYTLQEGVNKIWGLEKPTPLGRTIVTPHAGQGFEE